MMKNDTKNITEWFSKLMLSLYNYFFNYVLTSLTAEQFAPAFSNCSTIFSSPYLRCIVEGGISHPAYQ